MAKSNAPNVHIDWDKGGIQISLPGGSSEQKCEPEDILEVGNFSALQMQYGVPLTMTGGNTPKLHIYSAMILEGPWQDMTGGGLALSARTTAIATLDGMASSREMYRYLKWGVSDTVTMDCILQLKVLLRR